MPDAAKTNANIQEDYRKFLEDLAVLQKQQNALIAAYRQKLEQRKLATIQKRLASAL
ncbi:MAG: hypothetical protein Q8Q39_01910 [bacterium]|nr:hypothetical protein [bacterium]